MEGERDRKGTGGEIKGYLMNGVRAGRGAMVDNTAGCTSVESRGTWEAAKAWCKAVMT